MTTYEQRDQAMPISLPCFRCGRRSYYKASELDAFDRGETTDVDVRCAGCGETVSSCFCVNIRGENA